MWSSLVVCLLLSLAKAHAPSCHISLVSHSTARLRHLGLIPLPQVAHHPSLSQSLDLLVFLDASDAGLEAAKCYIEAGEGCIV